MKLSVPQLQSLITNGKLDYRKMNVIGVCPKCGGDEFGISIEDNHRFGCYRKNKCGFKGNIFTLLKFIGKLGDYLDEGEIYSRTEDKLVKKLIIKEEEINLELETINQPIGWKRVYQNDYLDSRGFEESDYKKFKVGVTHLDPKLRDKYVVFLIELKGELKGYVGRHIWSKKEIEEKNREYKEEGVDKKILRWCNSATDFSKLLGGEEELSEDTEIVILVEGLFDKRGIDKLMNLDTQKEVKCCCTFKCDVSPEQVFRLQQFKNIKHIILLYDPDVISQIQKVGLFLEDKFQEVQIGFNETGKDPDEMNNEELDKVLSNLYYPENFVLSKLPLKKLL